MRVYLSLIINYSVNFEIPKQMDHGNLISQRVITISKNPPAGLIRSSACLLYRDWSIILMVLMSTAYQLVTKKP